MTGEEEIFVRLELKALVVDPTSETPVIVLQVQGGTDLLPIWIGAAEAQAIAMAVQEVAPPRPMTHDLLASVINETGFQVSQVRIHSLDEGVFKASTTLVNKGDHSILEIDSRPSDAIALALRTNAPMSVARAVLESARVQQKSVDEALRTVLEQIDPEDLGPYEM